VAHASGTIVQDKTMSMEDGGIGYAVRDPAGAQGWSSSRTSAQDKEAALPIGRNRKTDEMTEALQGWLNSHTGDTVMEELETMSKEFT
jgi:hypothetical protein